jgi:hypothetical protein
VLHEDKGNGSACEVTVRPRRASCVLPLTAPMPSGHVAYILPGISDFSLTFRKIYTSAALLSQAQMAIVVPGSQAVSHPQAKAWGLSLYTPVIVKYRDAKTDARTQLETLLR